MQAACHPPSTATSLCEANDVLAAQAEDAGLNATHVREQVLVDGWLLRFANSRAKRARCINAIGAGVLSIDAKLERAQTIFAAAGLPLLFRITPFSQPAGLDRALAERGFVAFEESRVMLRPLHPSAPELPRGPQLHELDAGKFAATAGALYGDSPQHIAVDIERAIAFPGRGIRLVLGEPAAPLAVGCVLLDGTMAGIYGLHTRSDARGCGYASRLIDALLQRAGAAGASHACLQVGAANEVARRLYHKLGFADRYAYWYRARNDASI